MYTRKETANIYCGINILANILILIIMEVLGMCSDWSHGMIFVILSSAFVIWINYKKYKLIKQENIVSFFRAVIIDGSCLVLSYIGLWFNLFVPDPFSWEEFLHPSGRFFIIPVGWLIIGVLAIIPMKRTNNKILKLFDKT